MIIDCPECDSKLEVDENEFDGLDYATTDCPECGTELEVHKGGSVIAVGDDDYDDDDEDDDEEE
jgi:ssDNA-binding Zn-finger/Zn-ribbon topoisomerase 1